MTFQQVLPDTRSLVVPLDVVLHILDDLVDDKHALAKCARTSRDWLYDSRRLIYRTLSLDLLKMVGNCRDFFQQRPAVCPFVHDLHLHGGLDVISTKARLSCCALAAILEDVPHIQTLHLTGIILVTCSLKDEHPCLSIRPMLSLRCMSMHRLVSVTAHTNPFHLPHFATGIEKFRLSDVEWLGAIVPNLRRSQRTPFQSLSVTHISILFQNAVCPRSFVIPTVRDVRALECFNVHPGSCASLRGLICANASTLESLYFAARPSSM